MLMYLLFFALQRWQQDSMEISSEPRLLSIMVFLCSYNEIDGITQVVAFPFPSASVMRRVPCWYLHTVYV